MSQSVETDLSYGFARDKGIVLLERGEGAARLGVRNGADPFAL